jgi:hypothetical protein
MIYDISFINFNSPKGVEYQKKYINFNLIFVKTLHTKYKVKKCCQKRDSCGRTEEKILQDNRATANEIAGLIRSGFGADKKFYGPWPPKAKKNYINKHMIT